MAECVSTKLRDRGLLYFQGMLFITAKLTVPGTRVRRQQEGTENPSTAATADRGYQSRCESRCFPTISQSRTMSLECLLTGLCLGLVPIHLRTTGQPHEGDKFGTSADRFQSTGTSARLSYHSLQKHAGHLASFKTFSRSIAIVLASVPPASPSVSADHDRTRTTHRRR
jgi:hypothetical protein